MTRELRQRGLMAMAGELRDMGYFLPGAQYIKGKHITALVGHWKADGIADQTIRNRLSWLRWLAMQVGKRGLLPRDNDTYGLAERGRFSKNRAKPATQDNLANITDPRIRVALRMEAAFGMRREEVLKLRLSIADKGNRLCLKASWCKGGRYREIPVTHPEQRKLIEEFRTLAGDGHLIGDGRNYYQAMKFYDNWLVKSGYGGGHAGRHAYAQWRYLVLTGWECPAAGGRTADQMTPAEQKRDFNARKEISQELGHGRIDVTDTYLGRRWAQRSKAAA